MTTNYPRNCWWVAAASTEVRDAPLGRWLLDTPIVLFRSGDTVAALADRCIHRWAPLSQGEVVAGSLVCRYHGARFEADGRCSRIPSQKNVASAMRVQSFRVIEQDGFIWIWMGEPELCGSRLPPRLEFNNGGQWRSMGGYMPVEANYFLLQENVLDLTHFGYLHATTLSQEGWDEGLSEVTMQDEQVTYRKAVTQAPIAPFMNLALDMPAGALMDRVDWGSFVSPSTHIAGIDFDDPRPAAAPGTPLMFRIAHLTTPISEDRSHYWWAVGQNYGTGEADERHGIFTLLEQTFQQDKDMLEAIQSNMRNDRREKADAEVSLVADRPALHARHILKNMMKAEANEAAKGPACARHAEDKVV